MTSLNIAQIASIKLLLSEKFLFVVLFFIISFKLKIFDLDSSQYTILKETLLVEE